MSLFKSIRKVNLRAEGRVCSFELNAKRRTIDYKKKAKNEDDNNEEEEEECKGEKFHYRSVECQFGTALRLPAIAHKENDAKRIEHHDGELARGQRERTRRR
jgi:hypothetical protein